VIPVLSAKTMRDLGHAVLARAQAAEDAERLEGPTLTDEGVEKLAEIVAAGSLPTLGFFRRYREKAAL
jgi:hypothetical protein